MMKKAAIKTWGCQMNVYDSARIADVVKALGYAMTEDVTEADLVIFNTCHIREKASEKLFSDLGRVRPIKEARQAAGGVMLIAVGGCVAQAEGAEIQRRMPYVDIVFGPQTYHRLPEMIAHALRREGRVLDVEFPPAPKFDYLPAAVSGKGVTAFLTVQEGCDKFCSYCVVPYTRGAEYVRPVGDVMKEARLLVDQGVREITLLGQNVNAYRDGSEGLGALIRRLAELPELLRIRYTTSHPLDMDDDLIVAHQGVPKLMPFLHLPVQSGSDRILAAMNRKHTADDYRRIVDKLRTARPDLALSSDFIVGFPGETDDDFRATLKLVQDVGYAQAYSFKYSRRPGTPGAVLPEQVPAGAKNDRLKELQALLNSQQETFNASMMDRTLPVLFENTMMREGHVFGRTPYLQAMQVKGGPDLVGKEIFMRVSAAGRAVLKGVVAA